MLPSVRPTLIRVSLPLIRISEPAPVTVAVPVAAEPLRPPMFSVVARWNAAVEMALPVITSLPPLLTSSVPCELMLSRPTLTKGLLLSPWPGAGLMELPTTSTREPAPVMVSEPWPFASRPTDSAGLPLMERPSWPPSVISQRAPLLTVTVPVPPLRPIDPVAVPAPAGSVSTPLRVSRVLAPSSTIDPVPPLRPMFMNIEDAVAPASNWKLPLPAALFAPMLMKGPTPTVSSAEPAPVTISVPLPLLPMLMPSLGPGLPVPSMRSLPPPETVTLAVAPASSPMPISAAELSTVLRVTVHCEPAPLISTSTKDFSVPSAPEPLGGVPSAVLPVTNLPPLVIWIVAVVTPPAVPVNAST